jgi:hypothetical protein
LELPLPFSSSGFPHVQLGGQSLKISRGISLMSLFSSYMQIKFSKLGVAHSLWSHHKQPSKSEDMMLAAGHGVDK